MDHDKKELGRYLLPVSRKKYNTVRHLKKIHLKNQSWTDFEKYNFNFIRANQWVEKLGQCFIAFGGLISVANGFICIITFRIELIIMGLLYW